MLCLSRPGGLPMGLPPAAAPRALRPCSSARAGSAGLRSCCSYETANNIYAEETGFLKRSSAGPGGPGPAGGDSEEADESLVQHGSYSYTAPDGSVITLSYTADEMGFRASGDHIPTPPPVPPEIQRSLDIIYAQIQRDQVRQRRQRGLTRGTREAKSGRQPQSHR